jgi:hypothetical protein
MKACTHLITAQQLMFTSHHITSPCIRSPCRVRRNACNNDDVQTLPVLAKDVETSTTCAKLLDEQSEAARLLSAGLGSWQLLASEFLRGCNFFLCNEKNPEKKKKKKGKKKSWFVYVGLGRVWPPLNHGHP